MADELSRDDLLSMFIALTDLSPTEARRWLVAHNWDFTAAADAHEASMGQPTHEQHEDDDADYEDDDESPQQPQPSGGRRLGEGPAIPPPIPDIAPPSKPAQKPATQKKFATLGDFSNSSNDPDSHDLDDDDKQDLFAGGEKSGLAVQNPDDIKRKILEKATKRSAPPPKERKPPPSHFTGTAYTLGGDDAPSRVIAPVPRAPEAPERVDRVLHFWNDGFSVDDGDLYPASDPRNADILNLIRQGRAPLHIMNVKPGQEIEVELKQHNENYVKPKKKYTPFGGEGTRLGAPVPGFPPMPGAFSTESAAPITTTSTAPTTAEVDEAKPIVTLRISLGGGTRLTARFNTSHTIGDVYAFVRRADTGNRNFVLQTTFPTTVLDDHSKILGDMPEFKRGGAVVQKYV